MPPLLSSFAVAAVAARLRLSQRRQRQQRLQGEEACSSNLAALASFAGRRRARRRRGLAVEEKEQRRSRSEFGRRRCCRACFVFFCQLSFFFRELLTLLFLPSLYLSSLKDTSRALERSSSAFPHIRRRELDRNWGAGKRGKEMNERKQSRGFSIAKNKKWGKEFLFLDLFVETTKEKSPASSSSSSRPLSLSLSLSFPLSPPMPPPFRVATAAGTLARQPHSSAPSSPSAKSSNGTTTAGLQKQR